MQKSLFVFSLLLVFADSFSQTLYTKNGIASYYANFFNGRKTANGEIFSNKTLTAAHRTLPFGTIVKVTNLENNRSIVVRINDRGPYFGGRIIDLSRAAADSLNILYQGWAKVLVEELPQEPPFLFYPAVLLTDSDALIFPDDWVGNWHGNLKSYSAKGLEQIIPVQLVIEPNIYFNRWILRLAYDTYSKTYELVKRGEGNDTYSIDEKNGIDIPSSVFGNHFISRFSLNGILFECTFNLITKKEMRIELFEGEYNRTWTTGNIIQTQDSVPEVGVFQVNTLQEAILYNKEK
ncbi:MAG: septal ring lytic transglycosylase RlpA family protein [Chitinophagales bacterium]|nr:septal ring lytic transglycosylase RlpA family protein [Chitinophagales bacterium]